MGVCWFWLAISWIVGPVLGFIIAQVLLQQRLSEAGKRSASLEEALAANRKEADDLAEGLKASIASKDGQINDLQAQIEGFNSQVKEVEAALAARALEVDSLRSRIDLLQATAIPDCGPDDLTEIEGIGPRISKLLVEHGVMTFRELAETPTPRVKEMLREAGLGRGNVPDTWPGQAALAADHKWDELRALQDQLRGGRKV